MVMAMVPSLLSCWHGHIGVVVVLSWMWEGGGRVVVAMVPLSSSSPWHWPLASHQHCTGMDALPSSSSHLCPLRMHRRRHHRRRGIGHGCCIVNDAAGGGGGRCHCGGGQWCWWCRWWWL